jgi:hypothetical protein
MNQPIYRPIINNLGSTWKKAYLANESNLILDLGSTIKQIKFEHNYIFMNKLISLKLNLNIYNNILLASRFQYLLIG